MDHDIQTFKFKYVGKIGWVISKAFDIKRKVKCVLRFALRPPKMAQFKRKTEMQKRTPH